MHEIRIWHIRQESIVYSIDSVGLKRRPEIELAADELSYIMNSKHLD